jgi:Leucine-rich repeat (LRR) protein
VSSIILSPGNITKVENLPHNILRFECRHNMITSLANLPPNLKELIVPDNYLQSIDLKQAKEITELNVSGNQLAELGPLGKNLKILECERNHLVMLDLLPCKELTKLHCSHNPLLVIKDPPPNLADFVMDNNPLTEIQRPFRKTDPKETETKIDYIEAIQSYFKMKAEYETKETALKRSAFEKEALKREGKRRASSVKPPCINCKRKVGTIFSLKDKKYRAI